MFLNSSKSSKQESITAAHNVCKVAKAILDFFLLTLGANLQKRPGVIHRSYHSSGLRAGKHAKCTDRSERVDVDLPQFTNGPVRPPTGDSRLCRKQNSIKPEIAAPDEAVRAHFPPRCTKGWGWRRG